MATNNPASPNGNKRKRGPEPEGRATKSPPANTNGDNVSDAMYASLLQGIQDEGSSLPVQDDPSRTAQAALQQQQSNYPEPSVFDQAAAHPSAFGDHSAHMQQNMSQHQMQPGGQGIFDARQNSQQKPPVGTAQWHQLRKDNHKEVERRRREVINEGIENIAKMIPGSDKNKGAVLQNACRYISELQTKIASFDNERNVFEITQHELTKRNDSLRDSAQRAWQETSKWMGRCREAGLQFDDYDSSVEAAEVLEDNANMSMTGISSTGDVSAYTTGTNIADKADIAVS